MVVVMVKGKTIMMTQVDEVERSLLDDDLMQVNDSTQLDDDLTQVDDDQTQVNDDDPTQVDADDIPTLVDDSPQGSSGGLQKSDEIYLTQRNPRVKNLN